MKFFKLALWGSLMIFSPATLVLASQPDSLVYYMEDDTLTIDTTSYYYSPSEITDSIESNFDANLDSTLNLYYVKEQLKNNLDETQNSVMLLPDFPDSVYIERLAAIPTSVNLTYNSIVKRYIDVYARQKRSSVEVMLGLSEHYFPIFDDIFDFYDVPNEMKYMSIIESALNPRAYSRTRAVGLWQFMYGTGRMYGLEVNSLVDDRCDPYKASHAAAKYVKDLYSIYHDWILVIAAYNCGPGNVNKAIRRSGGKTNYWDIYYYLPRETRGHVPAFIAATYIMNYYSEHNLVPAKVELPVITDTLQIQAQLHLRQVSEILGIPLEQLRDLNPQYRADIVPASSSKTYALIVPNEKVMDFIDLEDSIFAYKDSVFFDPTKMVISPSSKTGDYFVPEAPGADYTKLTYTVKSGDNLGFISDWYGVSIQNIKNWNTIHRNSIRAGQRLAIYKHKKVAASFKEINTMTFAQKQARIGKTVTPPAQVLASSQNISGEYITYVVRSGDTLWDIAKKFPGVSDAQIMRLNNLSDVSKIKPGQELKIKPKN